MVQNESNKMQKDGFAIMGTVFMVLGFLFAGLIFEPMAVIFSAIGIGSENKTLVVTSIITTIVSSVLTLLCLLAFSVY